MKKCYIVGCSRSGTSQVQKRITELYDIWSLPETEFFIKKKESIEERIALIQDLISKANLNLKNKLEFSSKKSLFEWLITIFDKSVVSNYLIENERYKFFDQLLTYIVTERTESDAWLEKTPTHYQHCEGILANENTKVLFVLRNGLDVAASIRDRALKNPELFRNQLKLDYSINLWNDSVKKASSFNSNDSVKLVSFSDFVESETDVLADLAMFLELRKRESPEDIKIKGDVEVWKRGTDRNTSKPISKWPELFNDKELTYLKDRLMMEEYEKLVGV